MSNEKPIEPVSAEKGETEEPGSHGFTLDPELEEEEKKSSPEMQAQIDRVREIAVGKATEILSEFDQVESKTAGWDAADQPDYKRTIAGQIDFIGKRLSKFSDDSKTVYLLNTAIEKSAHDIIKSLNEKIDEVGRFEAVPEEERTVRQKGRMAATVNQSLDIYHVLTSSDWIPAYATIKDWESAVYHSASEDKKK